MRLEQKRNLIAAVVIISGAVALAFDVKLTAWCADCPAPEPYRNEDEVDDHLPDACMAPADSLTACIDEFVRRYYSARVGSSEPRGDRGGSMVRLFERPLLLSISSRAGSQKHTLDGADDLSASWEAELNRFYNHPRPQNPSEFGINVDQQGIQQPMRSPLFLRGPVYAFWFGRSDASKRQIMSCDTPSFGEFGVEVSIADRAANTFSLNERERDLVKACLYYALGAPVPAWFRDDEELHWALLVAPAFRSCVQKLLPGNIYRIQKVTEDPSALQSVETCMRDLIRGS